MTSVQKEFTILLVDDRRENLIALEELLSNEARVFIIASSGEEALKILLRPNDIGLILLDVQMPEMDGFEVARLLKTNAKTKDISIIFVTAINKDVQYVLKGFEEGAVDYLQKPLDPDITKAKVNVFERLFLYQKELKNTLVEKEKVNKQLERFTYMVAHDLKSPLSGIYSLLSMLRYDERLTSMQDIRDYVNITSNAVSHLSNMIESILAYSRQSETQQTIEEVDTNELVGGISKLLFPPMHINIIIEGKFPTIRTKKIKLQQVFQNLISNAIKYNEKGRGEIIVGVNEKADFYEFYVKDNGPGIPKKDQHRIFQLFETMELDQQRESSTGIGLNLLKMLVEEQGGQIWVTSEVWKGSTFYFQWRKEPVS